MYKSILIPVENTPTDRTIIEHVRPLARLGPARLILMHVADGWVARNYDQLKLQESEEMRGDQEYLTSLQKELQAEGFEVTTVLAKGEPATEIIKRAREEAVELIAMATHGHRLLGDILRGSTADKVRHQVSMPVLLLKAKI